MIKKVMFFIVFLSFYVFAQEIPAWIDTSETGFARYNSVSNAKPLPVKNTIPILRLSGEINKNLMNHDFDFLGNYDVVEIAYKDTGSFIDTIFVYTGIKGVSDTLWSRVNVVDLSDWSTKTEIVVGFSNTKQFWVRSPKLTLLRLQQGNTAGLYPNQKGLYYIEAK